MIISVVSRIIVGRQAHSSLQAGVASEAFEMGMHALCRIDYLSWPVHNRDSGVHKLAVRESEQFKEGDTFRSVDLRVNSYEVMVASASTRLGK